MHAIAYLNWGRWVADCPNPQCTNALSLDQGQSDWVCRWLERGVPQGCGTVAVINWPADADAVERDLAGLPEGQRHWRPEPDVVEEQP